MPGQGITIKTDDRFRYIWVPADLVGYAEVRDRLHQIRPVSQRTIHPNHYQRLGVIVSVAVLALFVATVSSDNRVIVIPSGLTLIALVACSAILVRRNPNIDSRTKRGTLFTPIVLVVLAMKVYMTWLQGA